MCTNSLYLIYKFVTMRRGWFQKGTVLPLVTNVQQNRAERPLVWYLKKHGKKNQKINSQPYQFLGWYIFSMKIFQKHILWLIKMEVSAHWLLYWYSAFYLAKKITTATSSYWIFSASRSELTYEWYGCHPFRWNWGLADTSIVRHPIPAIPPYRTPPALILQTMHN